MAFYTLPKDPCSGIPAAGRMSWRAARPQSVAYAATVKF